MDHKLYILIREDIPIADQGVQAGHAVAAWCAQFYRAGNYDPWNNSTLIYVTVPNIEFLKLWMMKAEQRGYDYQVFNEPDMANEPTTIACAVPAKSNLFDKLPLWDPVTATIAQNF